MAPQSARLSEDHLFASYVELATGLVDNFSGSCLLDGQSRIRGVHGSVSAATVLKLVETLNWRRPGIRQPALKSPTPGQWLTLIPLEQTDGTLLGMFGVQQSLPLGPDRLNRHAEMIAQRLKPLLNCIHRELVEALPKRERIQALTERTAELEWLFKLTGRRQSAATEPHPIESLLAAAIERLGCVMGVIEIPDKRICIRHVAEPDPADSAWSSRDTLESVWRHTRASLLHWAQRQDKALVVNSAGRNGNAVPRCKILSVRVARESSSVPGFLAFYNPPFAPDFLDRHVYLAQHLGVKAASVVDRQFDLMTGLYTRGGLVEAYPVGAGTAAAEIGCVVYIDVDGMQSINQLLGFELGNELLVRLADLLTRPLLPDDALCARVVGDRFAVAVPHRDRRAGAALADELRDAVRTLKFGPAEAHTAVTISCGVADIAPLADGLDRALTAAEIACKAAKSRGRDRVECYAVDDRSMIQRNDDALAVRRLRDLLGSDRLLLYLERVRPLKNPGLASGYEVSLRIRDDDEIQGLPLTMRAAAQRYQLLPTLDQWVLKQVLQMLATYRAVLQASGVWIAVNISEQSIADSTFVDRLDEELRTARLPAGCLAVNVDEHVATTRLAAASAMVKRLRAHGCTVGLQGFGLGSHALSSMTALGVSRIKIGHSTAAVRALAELAAEMGVASVAEGVNDEAAARRLRELSVDFAMGAAAGRPEPMSETLRRLASDESQRVHREYLEL